ncbi:hypothetical protein M011DRAFT_47382 [Sporormia fimetaria CBS 119925]|uniref:Uncharacterized protein n=1 Tax=Sporormia fimetaria CBS 119925 TaxID=1340428 RepID=A0A6A6VEF8_9PLEO|nr:hypothetical protein M011DRAFT_47382 [Sporormia fimetaria CBS 119925]
MLIRPSFRIQCAQRGAAVHLAGRSIAVAQAQPIPSPHRPWIVMQTAGASLRALTTFSFLLNPDNNVCRPQPPLQYKRCLAISSKSLANYHRITKAMKHMLNSTRHKTFCVLSLGGANTRSRAEALQPSLQRPERSQRAPCIH